MKIIKEIAKLIQNFMELEEGQVYLYNNKYIIPNDKKLRICLSIQGESLLSNNNKVYKEENLIKERIDINKQTILSIDIYSYGNDAINRKEEILMALNTSEAERIQEEYSFHLGKLSTSFTNNSELEGTKILNSFNILINVISKKNKIINSSCYEYNNVEVIKND